MKKYVLVLWVLLLASCATEQRQQVSSQSSNGPSKPNIVILFADDLGYGDLGSYGHPYHRTPHLDQLAQEGQRWTDFYVAAPVCSPSRGALLTGKLPNRTGLYGRQIGVFFPNAEQGMPHAERTMAEALGEQGYTSAIIGKWHLGDKSEFYPTRHGFDYWYGIPYSNDMDWAGELNFDELIMLQATEGPDALRAAVVDRQKKYFDPKVEYWNVPIMRSRKLDDGSYEDAQVERPAQQTELTKRHTAEALSFIEDHQDQPFLLYVPYSMPHTPIFASPDFSGRSIAGRYGDVIEELDWSVGQIVEKIKALGLADNTLIVFSSDNGPWLTMFQHGGTAGLLKHGKGTTFEGGMRVPGIFWGPNLVQPGTVSHMGSTLDLYVTALELAGANATPGVDGFDLSPTLSQQQPSARETLMYYRQGELRAIRKGKYKMHLVTEGAYGQPPQRTVHDQPVLYNLQNDPAEKYDVAHEHPEIVSQLQTLVNQHKRELKEKPPLFDARLAKILQPSNSQK